MPCLQELPAGISSELKDFLKSCLERAPSQRIKSDKSFAHAWVLNVRAGLVCVLVGDELCCRSHESNMHP